MLGRGGHIVPGLTQAVSLAGKKYVGLIRSMEDTDAVGVVISEYFWASRLFPFPRLRDEVTSEELEGWPDGEDIDSGIGAAITGPRFQGDVLLTWIFEGQYVLSRRGVDDRSSLHENNSQVVVLQNDIDLLNRRLYDCTPS